MKSIRQLGKLLSSIVFALVLTSPAQATETSVPIPNTSNKTCQQAIDFAGRELASKGAFVPFTLSTTSGGRYTGGIVRPEVYRENGDFGQEYYSYPTNRAQVIGFRLSGDPDKIWFGVMSSPQFLTTLASQIMAECPEVGMVKYHHWLEGFIPVGYFSDGTARAFTWVNAFGKMQWGYYYSP